jgi:hypothetical protein
MCRAVGKDSDKQRAGYKVECFTGMKRGQTKRSISEVGAAKGNDTIPRGNGMCGFSVCDWRVNCVAGHQDQTKGDGSGRELREGDG